MFVIFSFKVLFFKLTPQEICINGTVLIDNNCKTETIYAQHNGLRVNDDCTYGDITTNTNSPDKFTVKLPLI